MLLWKKDRKPRLAFLRAEDLQSEFAYSMRYREWKAVSFEDLSRLPDEFFFPG